MQTIIITGTIGRDAETRSAGSSDVVTFSVAANQGFGDKKQTNWYRCNMWGKRGTSLLPYLLKGVKVAVSGELELREYQGKPQMEINATTVDLMGGGQKQQAKPQQRDAWGEPGLDDNVPF